MNTAREPNSETPSCATRPPDAQVFAEAKTSHLNLVIVGHVDDGKSTLVGRLLFDTGSLPEGKVEQIQAACEAEGMEFEYAFLTDALLEEQAQNVTMDTTRVPFRTPHRNYTIIDAPGHKEFLKNMVTGAASADAAVLMVDANHGVREQTRRHGYLLSLLGIQHVVVAVNKMDLVGYDHAVYSRIQAELGDFLGKLGIEPARFVPIAAKHGEGLLQASARMPWYKGPALLDSLNGFTTKPAPVNAPLRLIVQDIYRFDVRRIVAGVVAAGGVGVGDSIEFQGKRTRVKTIERWPAPPSREATAQAKAMGAGRREQGATTETDQKTKRRIDEKTTDKVEAGSPFAITLEDELFVERGQVGASPDALPVQAQEFCARIFWLHPESLRVGDVLPVRIATQQVDGRILAIKRVLDTLTLQPSNEPRSEVKRHEVAEVLIRGRRPFTFDPGGSTLGRFVLIRNRRIAGGGVIDAAVAEQPSVDEITVNAAARSKLLGHRGAVVWLTGLSGSGKSVLADALEQRLYQAGVLPAVLDGDVLRAGLCSGLGYSDEDRRENIRRIAEAALLVAETGAVAVAAAISPFRADRKIVEDRCKAREIVFAEVYVNASLEECERRDPKQLYARARAGLISRFTGIDSPYEVPLQPALELLTDKESVEESADRLCRFVLKLVQITNDGASRVESKS